MTDPEIRELKRLVKRMLAEHRNMDEIRKMIGMEKEVVYVPYPVYLYPWSLPCPIPQFQEPTTWTVGYPNTITFGSTGGLK
jgi:hypothetical protein